MLAPERARAIGAAARRRILAGHTYRHRSEQLAALMKPWFGHA
jgi:spore maturation protein CgeB